jgi:hypothetical protein
MNLVSTERDADCEVAAGHVRIGVVGYCPPTKFDEQEARRMIVEAYDLIAARYNKWPIAIISGLTNVGVLAIAYDEAVKRRWRTVGVACSLASNHPLFPVDEQLIVGDSWGDESDIFVGSLHGLIRIGGGKQSIEETKVVKEHGLPTWEYELPIIE